MRKVLVFTLAITLVFSLASCGKAKNDIKNQGTISETDIDTPSDMSGEKVTVDDMTLKVPEGFGSLATDNVKFSDRYFENEDGVGLEIATIGKSGYDDYSANSPEGVLKTLSDGADSITDLEAKGASGKLITHSEDGNVIEMDFIVISGDKVNLAILYGEKDSQAIPISKKTQDQFAKFCQTIKF